jgi:hypothetical protein
MPDAGMNSARKLQFAPISVINVTPGRLSSAPHGLRLH